jgi:hypothetical protein
VDDLLVFATGPILLVVVFRLGFRLRIVFWSPDRVVLVKNRLDGRIVRVLCDAFQLAMQGPDLAVLDRGDIPARNT